MEDIEDAPPIENGLEVLAMLSVAYPSVHRLVVKVHEPVPDGLVF